MAKAPKMTPFTKGWPLGKHRISLQLWHPKVQGTALFCDIKIMQRSASLSKNLSPAPYSRETYTFCPEQALSFKVFRVQEGSADGNHSFLARTLDEVARNKWGHLLPLHGFHSILEQRVGNYEWYWRSNLSLKAVIPNSFWHQRLVPWKIIFLWTKGMGWFRDGSRSLHLLCIFFYHYYTSSTSDHQALDPGCQGPLP